ncbi:hypothetical protein GGR56DRAFT_596191 [Xylariaceae sp. FL0804]|nr:hypothetical protein GGR56DRAFT_596191 [Xylariaceae sp. FL0804]
MERIIDAPEHLVRAILVALCDDSLQRKKVIGYLDKANALPPMNCTDAAGGENPLKRKAEAEIKICVQCQEPYYATANGPQACLYHPGELEIDDESSTWNDWDDNVNGEQDCPDNRVDLPDGFMWNCCLKAQTKGGCTRGQHEAISVVRCKQGDNNFDGSAHAYSLGENAREEVTDEEDEDEDSEDE